jgi:hypothetical protein
MSMDLRLHWMYFLAPIVAEDGDISKRLSYVHLWCGMLLSPSKIARSSERLICNYLAGASAAR